MMRFYTDPPSRQETIRGFVYLALSLLVIPGLLQAGNALLAAPLSAGKLNFVYYCINFAAVVWIFRRFLRLQLRYSLKLLFPTLWYGALGYLGSQALGRLLDALLLALYPGFLNVNDQAVNQMLGIDFRLMALGVVFLVPVAEELFYRGLVFRNLYGKSPAAAYLVSMAAFAAIHIMGYLSTYSPIHLLLCFFQYLPAGFCLCWCYRQTGSIFAPIIMHAITNAAGVYQFLR